MKEKIIINADTVAFGRLCSFAAKKALEGNEIIIVNSEKTIISGNKKDIIQRYGKIRNVGSGSHSLKAPKYDRVSYKMLKRGIKGMLPNHKIGIGKRALLKIKCYDGIPNEFKNEKMIEINCKNYRKSIQLKEIAERI
jgi:large subunit ribosomal protein L13